MLGGADNPNGELLSYIIGADNETYHIENEFICQLDPSRFDLIPEYVIMECDKLIALPPAANQSSVARIA